MDPRGLGLGQGGPAEPEELLERHEALDAHARCLPAVRGESDRKLTVFSLKQVKQKSNLTSLT